MKIAALIIVSILFVVLCGDAAAQFSQPPPNRTAPICSERKQGTKECKLLPAPAVISLSCQFFETGGGWNLQGMNCTAVAWNNSNGAWTMIDPSLLKYDWASIVDGQEYYSPLIDAASGVVFCGLSRQGYVRVSAAGGTAVTEFRCDGYSGPDQPGGQ